MDKRRISEFYIPINITAIPQRRIIKPANALEYFSILPIGNFDKPCNEAKTIPSIVKMVVSPNKDATIITDIIFPLAAGYIKRGINGSQGPNKNIIKRNQGVKLPKSFES